MSLACDALALARKWRRNQLENEEHWIKTEDKLNYVYFNFLTCSAIFMYFELVCVLSKYKDVDAIWFKNARLDTNPITI